MGKGGSGNVTAAWVGGLLLGGWLAMPAVGADAAVKPTPPPAEIAAWIGQLGSAQYAQREAAARHLAAAGGPALPALGAAIAAGDFEVASRGVEIVRGMLAAEDDELSTAAARLLERVATADSAVGRLAAAALEFQQAGMAAAARERLEAQGAVFRERLFAVGTPGVEIEFAAGWRGGPEDWALLPRLRGVAGVSVHGVPLDADAVGLLGRVPGVRRIDLFGTAAPDAAVAALVARLPDTLVDVRKGGKLGVSSTVQAGPCALSAVQPGSAAARAGLRAGDVIVAAEGEPVASFEALTKRLATRGPGETVRLEAEREGGGGVVERFPCEVRLDAW
jgi:hypothetical protein